VIFRDATQADVPAVVSLVESAYRGEASRAGWTTEADLLEGQRTDVDAVAEIMAADASRLLLALDDGDSLVGCCQLEHRDGGVCYFGMFAVSPVLQGAGIGRVVLDEAERIAVQELGATRMEMTVIAQRRDLIEWYLRRGYVETGETRPFPHGDDRFGKPRRDDLVFTVLAKRLDG
jgi:ribosomal protein S18 acetylase RimI-like enzyme